MSLATEADRTSSAIEEQAQKMPSKAFIGLALGSIALSAGLALSGRRELANFVGHWAPTLLLFGVYNKLSKGWTGSEYAH
jgi:hypothetical protein